MITEQSAPVGVQRAWQIVTDYALEVEKIEPASLVAVYAIGSLPGGYYRAGQSDLDVALIVRDGSDATWESAGSEFATLNQKYQALCGDGTGFEGFPVVENRLYPAHAGGLLPMPQLNARLKLQSRLLYGSYDLEWIPMPTKADWIADAIRLNTAWQADGGDTQLNRMGASALVSHGLLLMRQYLALREGRICFNKLELVDYYLKCDPSASDRPSFETLKHHLEGRTLAEEELETLRKWIAKFHKVP